MSIRPVLLLGAVSIVASCQDPLGSPGLDRGPAFDQGGAAACPTAADFAVGDEASLVAALGAAVVGDVIGVSGTITLSGVVNVATAGVTLTCVTAGSGLVAGAGFANGYLIFISAPDVTIDRLVLDGSDALQGAVTSNLNSDGLVFTNNTVLAGPAVGAFFPGAAGAVVTDNVITTVLATGTGLHMQNGIDGSIVSKNVVTALGSAGSPPFGGIRLRDGTGVVLADNHVEGPWTNGLSLTNLQDSQVERNNVADAVNFGLATSFNSAGTLLVGNVFRNNQFTGTGSAASVPPAGLPPAGLMMHQACANTFIGNNLNGNFDDVGALFTSQTGANTMNGNSNVVFDDGDFDCDGDLASDPNHIGGKSLEGGFGAVFSGDASTTGGMK